MIATASPLAIAETYLAAWNAADEAERKQAVARCFAPEARYVDPLMRGDSAEGIAAMIGQARGQFPGLVFSLAGKPDGHGEHVRFSWNLGPAGGEAIAGGTDFVELDGEGRIRNVVGFLDKMPG